jgi:hypothetical protein
MNVVRAKKDDVSGQGREEGNNERETQRKWERQFDLSCQSHGSPVPYRQVL